MRHCNRDIRSVPGWLPAFVLAAVFSCSIPATQAQSLPAPGAAVASASPSSTSVTADTSSPFVATNWPLLLDDSGVADILDQANHLIGQEVANLEKAPLGFSPQQLAALQQSFRTRLGSEQLKQDVIQRLQQQLEPAHARQLQTLLQSPRMKFLQTLQAQLNDDVVRQSLRTYRVQVREATPNSDRLELLTTLDDTRRLSALETALKVELRKQMLVTVTQMETQETVPENLLDAQLQQYRQDVAQQISRNALDANLYLLKRTPSAQVQDLISSLEQPAFEHFMAICQTAIQDSFRAAREQLQHDLRLAAE